MLHELEGFESAQLRNTNAIGRTNSRKVVSEQIDDHHILGPVLFAFEQFIARKQVGLRPSSAAPRAFDGARLDAPVADAEKPLRRGAHDLCNANIKPRGERRW